MEWPRHVHPAAKPGSEAKIGRGKTDAAILRYVRLCLTSRRISTFIQVLVYNLLFPPLSQMIYEILKMIYLKLLNAMLVEH
ncbi:MAG: hypothetical protein LBB19_03660 [Puniceicoccales bacterium]|jgi:hypothetical protein|nr:hypothetical protein [Puniceicoccales bacterium]